MLAVAVFQGKTLQLMDSRQTFKILSGNLEARLLANGMPFMCLQVFQPSRPRAAAQSGQAPNTHRSVNSKRLR